MRFTIRCCGDVRFGVQRTANAEASVQIATVATEAATREVMHRCKSQFRR